MLIRSSEKLWVEIAKDKHAQEEGLMFRKSLGNYDGMVFSFEQPKVLKFWGVNTYIPLDIAFVDSEGVIVKIDKIKPMSQKTISSDVNCLQAIEANEGFFSSLNIKIGDKAVLDKDPHKGTYVRFESSKGK